MMNLFMFLSKFPLLLVFGIDKWLKDGQIEAITNNIQKIQEMSGNVLTKAGQQLGETPQSFNAGVFSILEKITNNILVPVGILILSCLMFYELIDLILQKTKVDEPIDYRYLIKWLFKVVLGVVILSNSWTIVNGIMGFCQYVITSVSGLVTGEITETTSSLDAFTQQLESYSTWTLIWFSVLTFTANLFNYIYTLIVPIFVFLRIFEIYLLLSASPIPMSSFMNKEFSAMGVNYLKRISAKGLQAVLMLVVLAMGAGLQSQLLSAQAGEIGTAIGNIFIGNVVLLIMLAKTGGVANAIMGI